MDHQKCSGYSENCISSKLCIVSQRRNQPRGNPMQNILGPIRRIRFTQSLPRQASIREKKGPSLGKIQVKNPHQRSPCATKFEDRSHEETERQQRCTRRKAWNLAKNIHKLKEDDKATFYSPGRRRTPSCVEFVEDSRAGMHMVSQRDFNSTELETMRTSRSPTTVMTANGEVRINEEATIYVKEFDLFVTVMLLEENPAVLSLGKLCEDHGYPYLWASGQKPHLAKNDKRIDCNITNHVPFVVPGLSASPSSATPTPTSSSSSSQDSVFDVKRYTEDPVTERSGSTNEELRGNPLHVFTETAKPK